MRGSTQLPRGRVAMSAASPSNAAQEMVAPTRSPHLSFTHLPTAGGPSRRLVQDGAGFHASSEMAWCAAAPPVADMTLLTFVPVVASGAAFAAGKLGSALSAWPADTNSFSLFFLFGLYLGTRYIPCRSYLTLGKRGNRDRPNWPNPPHSVRDLGPTSDRI